MPATEETWRSQKLLHRVFAVTGVGLFVSTLWMFWADHYREWKPYQRNMVKVDTTLTLMQEEQYQTEENRRENDRLHRKLMDARASALSEQLYEEFKDEVQRDIRERNEANNTSNSEYSFARLDAKVAAQKELADNALATREAVDALEDKVQKAAQDVAAAQAAVSKATPETAAAAKSELAKQEAELKKQQDEVRQAESKATDAEKAAINERKAVVDALNKFIDKAKFRDKSALNIRKVAAAKLDAKKAEEGILIRDDRPEEATRRAQAEIDKLKDDFASLTLKFEAAVQHRKNLQEIVKKLTADEIAVSEEIKNNEAALKVLQTGFKERQSTYFVNGFPYLGKRWLELPILDAFGSPRRPDNVWSDGLLINYNHKFVSRYDRCTTCHQAIEKSAPGSATEPAYAKERLVELILSTPPEADLAAGDKTPEGEAVPRTLERVFGLRLADSGLLNAADVTVGLVAPGKLGAKATLAPQAAENAVKTGEELRRELLEAADEPSADPNRPGILVGDVIFKVNDDEIKSRGQFERLVVGPSVKWGAPLRVTVRRGLPNPYVSHPRLDLFVGSLSPHKLQTFGCTVCHEGQGSATAFKWASHTPNDPEQRKRWTRDYGWFDNHHWIYPQNPQRFVESGCLKCHHNVTELEPSERFPDPPAPKVVHGHDVIRKYGCYGCHEINGFDGPNKRVGPDMRLEPVFFAVAEELLTHLPARRAIFQPQLDERQKLLAPLRDLAKKKLDLDEAKKKINDKMPPDPDKDEQLKPLNESSTKVDAEISELRDKLKTELADSTLLQNHVNRLDDAARLAERLVRYPEEDDIRRRLRKLLEIDKSEKPDAFGQTFAPASHKLSDLLKDIDTPGTLRKPGPSLRHVAAKDDPLFLYDWIAEPKRFRPSTRMPQFFGLADHLQGASYVDPETKRREPEPDHTLRKEQIEILGIATYLLQRSQPFEYASPPEAAKEDGAAGAKDAAAKIARGKQLFQTRGCLACHNHKEFPESKSFRPASELVQGPDLSGLSAKLAADRNPNGRKWLYSWIKEPNRYHTRTVMPDLFLNPEKDADGKATGPDPADDVVEYLLSVPYDAWTPVAGIDVEGGKFKLSETQHKALENFTLDNLKEAFFTARAKVYLTGGIPEAMRPELKGAEVELVGKNIGEKEWLMYIGRKSIGKYGCYGCHDIPGFEDAKTIGTGLADWGRKDPAKLAFEHIAQYLHGHGGGHAKPANGNGNGKAEHGHAGHGVNGEAAHDASLPPFYADQMNAGNRIGFIYQKLKEPRSYDYHKTENKRYNERLRMPQFPLSHEEREAVITFVLGLVAEPPTSKYVYSPSPRQMAIAEGRQVLEKFNCGGCHILEMDKWKVAYTPTEETPPTSDELAKVFPFLRTPLSPEERAAASTPDRRGRLHATLTALPAPRGQPGDDGLPELYDSEGDPAVNEDDYAADSVRVALDLWKPVMWNGQPRQPGVNALKVPVRDIEQHYPSHGGMLAKYLLQPVFKQQKQLDNSAKVSEAWGWLPPPLLREGSKVQAEWLHDFLLDPHPIRPAVVLRMPKFNMSPAEATKLVSYFAAIDNADYPYEFGARQREDHLTLAERNYQRLVGEAANEANGGERKRFDDALKIVTTVCVKCHVVGDFAPTGSNLVKGPNLARVDRRLRPTYLRDWIADPKRILPYTGMPVNIPFDENVVNYGTTIGQDVYHGNSLQQLDGLVDLLANFDEFTKRGRSIKSMVKVEPPPPATKPEEKDEKEGK